MALVTHSLLVLLHVGCLEALTVQTFIGCTVTASGVCMVRNPQNLN